MSVIRIAYVSNENPYDHANNGGIGTYTQNIAELMVKRGHQVIIVTNKAVSPAVVPTGINLYEVEKSITKVNTFIEEAFRYFVKIIALNQQEKIDIIEVPEWLAQGYFLATECELPIITRLHTPLFLIEEMFHQRIYRSSHLIKEFEKRQIICSQRCTSPSQDLAGIISTSLGVQAESIPNPLIVRDKLEEVTQSTLLKQTLLYLGRLEYRKGVLVLGRTLQDLMKKDKKIQIIFCGEDTVYKKQSVKKMLLDMLEGKENRVTFINHVTGEEKKQLLKKAEVVVIPSLWENYPYVCLEAMSVGSLVLASDIGGLSEIIEDGKTGYLFRNADSVDLSKKLVKILNLKNKERIREAAIQKIRTTYQADLIGGQMEALYVKYLKEMRGQDDSN